MTQATPAEQVPTEQQRRAIEAPMGPVLVVAGPGAGKTFCLIGRVGFLLAERKLQPQRICAVTFTNKAAEEIATRLHRSVGHAAEDVTRGTLHALCLGILREHGERLGLKRGFGIADEAYQLVVLARMDLPRKRRRYVVEDFGRHRLQGLHLAPDTERLYHRYRAYLAKQNLIDFDDIIALTRDLFEKHADVAEAVARRWDYLLVDEFQDLNPAQYSVLRTLAVPHDNFFAVGDDEQSIFSWTGADPGILLRFQRDYGIAAPIVLDENRRSARAIFEAARRLLGVNPRLFDKRLTASRESPFPVRAVRFRDEEAEAAWVVDDLLADRAEYGLGWGDYAVLYRRHSVGRQLEATLVRRGVPCRMARGRSLQDDPIVGYVVASLRVIANPGDPAAVEACAPLLLPEDLIERVRAEAGGGSFLDALRAAAAVRPKEDPDRKKMWRFIFHIENLQAIRRGQATVEAMVEELLSQFGGRYRNRLEDRHDELTDPADLPDVVELAGRLAAVPAGGVWVEPAGGRDIALRGMLRAAGVRVAHEPDRASYTLAAPAVTVFKALQLLHSREFREGLDECVTFDLETTGKDPATCEIIEIGAARVVRGQVTERFHSLIRPTVPISAGASEAHGYTAEDLADSPSFTDVWPRFRAFIGRSTLVAHNAHRFDVPVLRKAAAGLAGLDTLVFLDTYPLARSLYRESASLGALAQRFGISAGRAHHAEDDAVTLAAVFQKLGHAKVVRARKTSLTNLLDYLGLTLAFEPKGDAETEFLRETSAGYALGRFSDCLEVYASDRELDGRTDAPPVEWVIDKLGGAGRMERIRSKKTASQRYPEAMARLHRLLEASRADSIDESLARFLERVALSSSEGVEADPHRVNLLTLHSTKGLEFSRVYVLGVEDDQLPGSRALAENRKGEIEEHRRLLYVGMTRAEDRLVMTRVDARGGRPAGGNRFLDEMGVVASAPALPAALPGSILKHD